jgi:hypothetical protein
MRRTILVLLCVVAWRGLAVAHAQQSVPPGPTADPAASAEPPPRVEQSPATESAPSAQANVSAPPSQAPDTTAEQAIVPAEPETPAASTTDADEPATRRHTRQVGISPDAPQSSGLVLNAPMETGEETAGPASGDWHFDFHGFMRAPLRLGLGPGDDVAPDVEKGTKLHSPPNIPDAAFTDWRYINNTPGPWVELRFLYGNNRVTGNVSIAAYNITDGGYRNLQSQLGIDQAFITIDESDLFPEGKGGLIWNTGVFQNRYGAAGRYDAGKYETYLFGRTHVAGETLTLFYDFSPDLTLTFEHGLGVKLEAPPIVSALDPTPAYLPYPGPQQAGTQLLHHAHLMLSYKDLQIGAHYLTTWTDDAALAGEVDGRITTAGIDAKLSDSPYGDAYLGYSRLSSETPIRVGQGLEVLHSIAGWNLRDNFFGQASSGTGTIDTLLFQYVLSVSRLLRAPEPFWGQGPDVLVSVFGMYNHVKSDDPMFSGGKDKLKWGGDVTYLFFSFLGAGLRFDRVQPNLDDSTYAFSVLSPKIVLRSEFVTHEQVLVQWSHYINGDNVTAGYRSPAIAGKPDSDVFSLSASMWW